MERWPVTKAGRVVFTTTDVDGRRIRGKDVVFSISGSLQYIGVER